MSWARLDDSYCDHPKIVQAGNEAVGLHARSIAYCAKHHTDGVITTETVRMFCNGNGDDLAMTLCRVKLFERIDGGYLVHDFLDYNLDAIEVKRQQQKAVKRMRARRKRSRNVQANTSGPRPPSVTRTPGRVGTGLGSSSGSLILLPDPERDRSTFDACWQRYPNKRGKQKAREVWQAEQPPGTLILAALAWQVRDPEWLREGGQFIPRFATYLHNKRWTDEPSAVPVVNDVTAANLAAMAEALK